MGHALLPSLPTTRKWRDVVSYIGAGAGAAQVATAALGACEQQFMGCVNDSGVVESVWLLLRLPLAARGDDFTEELRGLGLDVPVEPLLVDVIAAVSDAIDSRLPKNHNRTDLGEIAQMATTETLAKYVGSRLNGLCEDTPEQLCGEFSRLATAKQFGQFAQDFFARFVHKTLESYLWRCIPEQVGAGDRFQNLSQARQFREALDLHCREAAQILGKYAGDWLKKHNYTSQGQIDRDLATRFLSYATTKLIDELRRRNQADGR